jgi:hypothetical protein
MNEHYTVNISEKHKAFLWMAPKTGSYHASFTFNHFDFISYSTAGNNLREKFLTHNHSMDLFPGHENYKLICTVRNPFTKLVSEFKYRLQHEEEFTTENFRNFFSEKSERNFDLSFNMFKVRKPDYPLRVEYLWHDYIQIPFVYNSKLCQSGILYELCKKKMNGTIVDPKEKDLYTKDMIENVKFVAKEYLEMFGYDYPY